MRRWEALWSTSARATVERLVHGLRHAAFRQYAILHTQIVEVLSPTDPFGVKAGGEGGTTPALAVIDGAIEDALAEFGPVEIEMPATPLRIWQAIQAARHAS